MLASPRPTTHLCLALGHGTDTHNTVKQLPENSVVSVSQQGRKDDFFEVKGMTTTVCIYLLVLQVKGMTTPS